MASTQENSKLNFQEYMKYEKSLTFLVGAGCSVLTPSNLPNARDFIKSIIESSIIESEVEKILSLEKLTLEQLLMIIYPIIGENSELLDFFSNCDKPNIEHFFLAKMIINGSYVITTNFDHLIETALLTLEVPRKKIVPVITQKDYEKYMNPEKLFESGRMAVYKLHGSSNNLITDENTQESLKNTIKLLGINQERRNIIQLEPYKAKVIGNISKDRTLIVLGYSGKNDFDITPTIKQMDLLKNLIWVNHDEKIKDRTQLKEIKDDNIQSIKDTDELDQLLLYIARVNQDLNIYRLDINTKTLLNELIESTEQVSKEGFELDLSEWVKESIKDLSNEVKVFTAFKIYHETKQYKDALRCLERIYRLAEDNTDDKWKTISLMNMGTINLEQNELEKALEWFKKALQSQVKLKVFPERLSIFKNIGLIYQALGNLDEAYNFFQQGLKINLKYKDMKIESELYNQLGLVELDRSNYKESIKNFEISLKIDEKLNNLQEKAFKLKNIAATHVRSKNISAALKNLDEAMEINDTLGNMIETGNILNNLGLIQHIAGNSILGIEKCNNALELFNQIQFIEGKMDVLNNLGEIYRDQWNFSRAHEYFKEAVQLAEDYGKIEKQAKYSTQIGIIFRNQDKYFEALEWLETALNLYDQIGNLHGKVETLKNVGLIYKDQRNFPKALRRFEKIIEIYQRLNDPRGVATILNIIGMIHVDQRNFNKALEN
ncbi:MAG: tetratricopeptide repeat protein, partial [Candidatus Lokiarchaeota archaeon]|nr:tetratricopeptide repeat protein [Candidatus Lokiarchaeota archaeon]